MASIINYVSKREAVCHIFSLLFVFDRLEDIGNLFSSVGVKIRVVITQVITFDL